MLAKKIEKYAGREIDFQNEVKLNDDGNGAYIYEWNLKDIKKPTESELKKIDVSDYVSYREKEKLIQKKEREILRRQALQELQAEGKLEADYG